MAEGLHARGWWVKPAWLNPALVEWLLNELLALAQADHLQHAGVGRGRVHRLAEDIRRDKIYWLDGSTLAQQLFLEQMEILRAEINQALFMGLFDFECHYALYEPGAFYKPHRDSFHGAANRVVSVVVYLNPGWWPNDGGQLEIFNESGALITSVLPEAGTIAVFLSEDIEHAVAVTHRQRASIAGWFRLNNSQTRRVDPPL